MPLKVFDPTFGCESICASAIIPGLGQRMPSLVFGASIIAIGSKEKAGNP